MQLAFLHRKEKITRNVGEWDVSNGVAAIHEPEKNASKDSDIHQ